MGNVWVVNTLEIGEKAWASFVWVKAEKWPLSQHMYHWAFKCRYKYILFIRIHWIHQKPNPFSLNWFATWKSIEFWKLSWISLWLFAIECNEKMVRLFCLHSNQNQDDWSNGWFVNMWNRFIWFACIWQALIHFTMETLGSLQKSSRAISLHTFWSLQFHPFQFLAPPSILWRMDWHSSSVWLNEKKPLPFCN